MTVVALVTGASGLLGRRVVPALGACGHRVYADADACAAVRELRPDVVVALGPPAEAAALMAAAEASGVQRVVAESTALRYLPGVSEPAGEDAPVDAAVAALEAPVLASLQVVGAVLRLGALHGPGTPFAPGGEVAARVRARAVPVTGRGRSRTSFVHVDDAVAAVLDAVESGHGIYNVVDDAPAAAGEWIPHLARVLGAPPPRRRPAWRARAAAVRRPGASNRRAREELRWRPEHSDWRRSLGVVPDRGPERATLDA